MKLIRPLSLLFAVMTTSCLLAQDASEQLPEMRYTDGHDLTIVGRYHSEKSYMRFPARYEQTLRKEVWELGRNSTGIGIRFRTDATTISVKWRLPSRRHLGFPHMPPTGVSGVDLYGYEGGEWQYINTGFPRDSANEATLMQHVKGEWRDYLINLPLYNDLVEISVGVNAEATLAPPQRSLLLDKKPIVYYGTSIAQGGCASRPGMAYTNILSRRLNYPFINLGFSGNGTLETSVGEAMCEIDASLYVLDCNPNTDPELIYDRTLALVKMLRECHAATPILFVERDYYRTAPLMDQKRRENQFRKNAELKRAYDALKKAGHKDLHYLGGDGLLGQDKEGTVDGDHPNDLGMLRMADVLHPVIRKIL